MTTNSLEFLVGITGSYAGAGIQYIVPAALVYYARKVRSFFLILKLIREVFWLEKFSRIFIVNLNLGWIYYF